MDYQKKLQKEWVNEDCYIERASKEENEETTPFKTHFSYIINALQQRVLEKTITFEDGTKEVLTYDSLMRVVQSKKLDSYNKTIHTTETTYDLLGRRKKLVQDSFCTTWSYDSGSRIIELVEDAGGSTMKKTCYSYTDIGLLETLTHPDGTTILYRYNGLNQLVEVLASDGSIHYLLEYDQAGRIIRHSDQLNQLQGKRTYSLDGQLIDETLLNGLEIKNTYDLIGRRTLLTLPDQSSIQYEYEEQNLKTISRKSPSQEVLYQHVYTAFDKVGRSLQEELIFNLGIVRTNWSNQGRLVSIQSPYFKESCEIDALERITQIETEDKGGLWKTSYAAPLEKSLKPSSEDQYDLNGNLVQKRSNEGCIQFKYDALSRVVEVKQNGIILHSYKYDLFHRRLIDQDVQYLYDGNWEMGKYQNGKAEELRIFGRAETIEHGPAIALELNGKTYAPIYNLTGSIATLVDENSNCIEWYRYSAFGTCESFSTNSTTINPWRFANKRFDEKTALIHFGRRDYDPSSGRFTTKDPFGFIDGSDRYAFANNDPFNNRDHFGTYSFSGISNGVKTWAQHLRSFIFQGLRHLGDYASMGREQILHHVMGGVFLLLLGYIKTEAETGVYGRGEVSNKVRVSFINGILTDYPGLTETLQGLSHAHGGVNIHYVYRPTKGWVWDLLHSALVKFGYVSLEAHQLACDWKTMIHDMGGINGGGRIIHYAHSIGSVETLRALSLLTPEEQKMVHVYAFGSPSLSTDNPNYQVHHYVAIRDGVSLIDFYYFTKAYLGYMPNVIFTGNALGIPLVDHLFSNQSYQDHWKAMGRTFIDWYGSLI